MLTGLEDITAATVVMIVLAGLAAGWIDAVVGGVACSSCPSC